MSNLGNLAPISVCGRLIFRMLVPTKHQKRSDHQNDHHCDVDSDYRRAHEQRLRRFAPMPYGEKCIQPRRSAFVFGVAWMLGDMAGRGMPNLDDVAMALSFRQPGAGR
ncbi:MAG: hypothetical protein ABWY45_02260 [Mycobacterium sp.]